MVKIGTKLRDLARRLELSDAEVARQIGIDPRRYGHYISGINSPNFKVLVDICRVLQTSPNELLDFGPKSGTKKSLLMERAQSILLQLSEDQLKLATKLLGTLIKADKVAPSKKRPKKQ